jgi:hypothetical protein
LDDRGFERLQKSAAVLAAEACKVRLKQVQQESARLSVRDACGKAEEEKGHSPECQAANAATAATKAAFKECKSILKAAADEKKQANLAARQAAKTEL